MLQTAPVLLIFPPTIGPLAKVEGDPIRFDFTGYVSNEGRYVQSLSH
jgi:oligosaccharyltransferase complex subunit gamma